MTYSNTPEGWSVNGETASKDEIAFMEGLATGLLDGFPAEYYRQYGYATENDSFALLSTHVYEEDSMMGSIASVIVSSGHPGNVKLSLTFGYDNQPSHLFFTSEKELGEISSILQDLLEDDDVQSRDVAILRHLQAIVFCMMNAITPEHIGLLPDPDTAEDLQYVGDVIRSQVEENTNCAIRTKVWGLPFDDDHILTVSSNEIIGDLSVNDDTSEIPCLQVEYEDRAEHITYTYSKEQNGDTVLDTSVGIADDYIEQVDGQGETIEEEIALFIKEIGGNIPSRKDVELITRMLSQAVLIDT